VGATTASTGAFTTLSATSTVSGAGFSAYLASPPAIGGTAAAAITGTTITANTSFAGAHNGTVGATTPATGAFTTLSASSTISGAGFTTYLASPPAIGGTAAAAITGTTIVATTNISSTRINPRIISVASSATPTPDVSTTDQYVITALSVAAAFGAPTGTPLNGQKLTIRIKDNGTARALTWNAIYRVIGTTLPTTTVISKVVYVGCIYNSDETTWDVVSVAQQA
jgi:hypothetical protein